MKKSLMLSLLYFSAFAEKQSEKQDILLYQEGEYLFDKRQVNPLSMGKIDKGDQYRGLQRDLKQLQQDKGQLSKIEVYFKFTGQQQDYNIKDENPLYIEFQINKREVQGHFDQYYDKVVIDLEKMNLQNEEKLELNVNMLLDSQNYWGIVGLKYFYKGECNQYTTDNECIDGNYYDDYEKNLVEYDDEEVVKSTLEELEQEEIKKNKQKVGTYSEDDQQRYNGSLNDESLRHNEGQEQQDEEFNKEFSFFDHQLLISILSMAAVLVAIGSWASSIRSVKKSKKSKKNEAKPQKQQPTKKDK